MSDTSDDSEDEPEDIILGFRGKSKYQIVVPEVAVNGAAESSVTRAAELVQQAFSASKIALSIVKESAMDAARPAFFIGATKFALLGTLRVAFASSLRAKATPRAQAPNLRQLA